MEVPNRGIWLNSHSSEHLLETMKIMARFCFLTSDEDKGPQRPNSTKKNSNLSQDAPDNEPDYLSFPKQMKRMWAGEKKNKLGLSRVALEDTHHYSSQSAKGGASAHAPQASILCLS